MQLASVSALSYDLRFMHLGFSEVLVSIICFGEKVLNEYLLTIWRPE